MVMEMEIPVIDFSKLKGDKRGETMARLHEACEKWGFFMIENHDIDKELMEKVKLLTKSHYEHNMKPAFLKSDTAKTLDNNNNNNNNNEYIHNGDWESTFFVWHRPNNTINDITTLSQHLRLNKSHMIEAFAGCAGPSVGTKVAIYPECPRPELIRGLREHTDAGGIILLLQDDQVPGLEFLKGGKWVKIPPSKNNMIFVNIGDQVEIVSNGVYKSAVHRVMAIKEGNRLSVATFYNPGGHAVISPASELQPPTNVRFEDYLSLYAKTKFGDKSVRFQSLNDMDAQN